MNECCSVPVLRESKQNLPAIRLGKKQALNNASLSEAQLNAINLGGEGRGWWRVGTEVEGFVRSWLCFKVTQSFISNTGEDEARFYEFLSSRIDRTRESRMVQALCLRQHMCGVDLKILFKTWQGEDAMEADPLRMRRRFATCVAVFPTRCLWLKLCVPQLRVAAASLSMGYASKELLAVAR